MKPQLAINKCRTNPRYIKSSITKQGCIIQLRMSNKNLNPTFMLIEMVYVLCFNNFLTQFIKKSNQIKGVHNIYLRKFIEKLDHMQKSIFFNSKRKYFEFKHIQTQQERYVIYTNQINSSKKVQVKFICNQPVVYKSIHILEQNNQYNGLYDTSALTECEEQIQNSSFFYNQQQFLTEDAYQGLNYSQKDVRFLKEVLQQQQVPISGQQFQVYNTSSEQQV